jgi:hypothetical protein
MVKHGKEEKTAKRAFKDEDTGCQTQKHLSRPEVKGGKKRERRRGRS